MFHFNSLYLQSQLMGTLYEDQRYFLEEIRPMNIEARYPDYKRSIANSLNEDKISMIVEQTKQLQQWILQKCLLKMRLSNSSENTSE